MRKFIAIALTLVMSTALVAQNPTKRLGIKSGSFTTVSTVTGKKTEAVTYFDDYGNLQASRAKTNVLGAGEVEVVTVLKDGKQYIVIPSMNQVQELPLSGQDAVNFLNLTDEVKEKYSIKELGTETIGDKDCSKYTLSIEQMGVKVSATVWAWNGFPIKTVMNLMGIEIENKIVAIDENAAVDPSMFVVPAKQ